MKKIFKRIYVGILALVLMLSVPIQVMAATDFWYYKENSTQPCRDVEFVFARGSGEEHVNGKTFRGFAGEMPYAASSAGASYRITDIDYEAVAVSVGNILGIYVSAGKSYSFGRSVEDGVKKVIDYYNSLKNCSRTYWVLGGYSQGAMVIANSLYKINPDKVVYIPLFGDPKTYLPEGKGISPPACWGMNFSSYRVRVPNCNTDNGILGQRKPYEVEGFEGLFGLWCNDADFVCGSSKNPLKTYGHSQYATDGSMRQASEIIASRLKAIKKNLYSQTETNSGIRLANITAESSEDPRLKAPVIRAKQRDDSSFRISWSDIPEGAAYFGIKINDYFLGYADAQNKEMIIEDVDFDNVWASCFWLTSELDMGYEGEIEIERQDEDIGSVPTNATWGGWRIIAIISLPFLGALLGVLAMKFWRDLQKIKSAPRAKALGAHDEKSAL